MMSIRSVLVGAVILLGFCTLLVQCARYEMTYRGKECNAAGGSNNIGLRGFRGNVQGCANAAAEDGRCCSGEFEWHTGSGRCHCHIERCSKITNDGNVNMYKVTTDNVCGTTVTSVTTTTTTTATTTTTTTTTSTDTTTTSTDTTTTTTTTTTTLPLCGQGEYLYVPAYAWSAPICRNCRYGTFREDESHSELECLPWKDCDDHEHVVEKASASQNTVCETTADCANGEYEYRAPLPGVRNRQCKPVTPCSGGQYVYRPATPTSDQRCRRCDRSDASFVGGCTSTTQTSTTATSSTRTLTTTTTSTKTKTTATETSSSSSTTTTATTTTIGGDADDANDDFILVLSKEDMDQMMGALEVVWLEEGTDKDQQVKDMLFEGFTLEYILESNHAYAKMDFAGTGITSAQLDAAMNSSKPSSSVDDQNGSITGRSTDSANGVVVAVVVCVILLAVVAAVAFICVKQKQKNAGGGDPAWPTGFENPLYATNAATNCFTNHEPATESAYMDLPAGGGASSGYMDVGSNKGAYLAPTPIAAVSGAYASSGYMDVSNAGQGGGAGGNQTQGYMDVAPEQSGFEDAMALQMAQMEAEMGGFEDHFDDGSGDEI